jgi:hypothetical protein
MVMDERSNVFSVLADCILSGGAYKAVKYINEKLTVKATRKRFKGKIPKNERRIEILFTVGQPNYEERNFIMECKKAGEPFPVKKIQVKFPKPTQSRQNVKK